MNRKVFLHMMLAAIVSGLLIAAVAGNVNSQVEEGLSWNFNNFGIQVSIKGLERQEFLADPVTALRLKGVQVPQSAEAPWREFTQALRQLSNSRFARAGAGRRQSVGPEALHYRITLRESQGVIYLGTGEANAGNPPAKSSGSARRFLEDPVGTLRAHGITVPSAEESNWTRLAGALKAVQLAHARSRVGVKRQGSTNPDPPAGIGKPDNDDGARNPIPHRTRIGANQREQTPDRRDTPPPRRPAARTPSNQNLATAQQPMFNRQAFENSLHVAVRQNVMGYTFLLIKDGRVAAEGAGGLARNAADGEMAMTTRTPQNLGSLFKFITGVTVLHILDRAPQGSAGGNNSFETRLDAPVALLYPQLWGSAIKWPTVRTITFRHLLQHRSGFRACSTPLGCFGKRYNDTLFGVRDYENINFQLLGFLIPLYTNPELIQGLNAVTKTVSEDEGDNHIQMVLSDRMDRFINRNMFSLAPGKISASCDAANEYKATGAYGYISKSDTGNGIITSRKAGGKPCVGSGGYWMSIRDFGAFVATALHSDRMLSQHARLEMYRSGMPEDDRLVWSFTTSDPWISDKFKMPTIIWSNGIQPYDGDQSFNTVLLRLPLNYELMVFTNSGGLSVNGLASAGFNAFRAGMEANFQ